MVIKNSYKRTYCVLKQCVHMLRLRATIVQTNAMFQFEKVFVLIVLVKAVSCTVAGLTYMDSLHLPPAKIPPGENPCNPLYWYPRQIPDYCYRRIEPGPITPKPIPVLPPSPTPVPVPPPPMPMPMPMPIPMPMPMFMPLPGPPLLMAGPPLPMPGPPLPMPGPPLPMPVPPYGAPIPMPGFPGPGQPYSVPAPQIGLVPGVNGLVSPEGAINILPFSDAYSDLLEKHKQKMIRIRLQNLLDEYEYPQKGRHRKFRRRHGCRY